MEQLLHQQCLHQRFEMLKSYKYTLDLHFTISVYKLNKLFQIGFFGRKNAQILTLVPIKG